MIQVSLACLNYDWTFECFVPMMISLVLQSEIAGQEWSKVHVSPAEAGWHSRCDVPADWRTDRQQGGDPNVSSC